MRTTWQYTPGQTEALKLSRSRLEMYLECKRCFWLLMRHNVKRPSIPGFTLNQAVDTLLKKEFDIYRKQQKPHPLMSANKLSAVPYQHKDLDTWRDTFKGIEYLVKDYNILIFGGLDDVWQTNEKELIVVDYKATSREEPVTELYPKGSYHDGYRRQLEVYQWLFKKNGFKVCPSSYIVYATGMKDKSRFSNKLAFSLNLIDYQGSTDWIDPLITEVYNCLQSDNLPAIEYAEDNLSEQTLKCGYCAYLKNRLDIIQKIKTK